jgi:hypothetical protein
MTAEIAVIILTAIGVAQCFVLFWYASYAKAQNIALQSDLDRASDLVAAFQARKPERGLDGKFVRRGV